MKYTFEIMKEYEDAFKGISVYSVSEDKKLMVDFVAIEELEDAQKEIDEAYQRGLEDSKKVNEEGCVGCEYADKVVTGPPCITCCNSYRNQWTAKKQDDKIEVGDEVEWDNDFTGDRFIVTRIYQPYGKKEQCDGIDDDGDVYRAVLIESLVKTGRHFEIEKILEEMKK